MSEIVSEWIGKAEGDWNVARREIAVTENPNWDAVCFHAHQCVEKLLKGLLIAHKVVPPKTHNLLTLHLLLEPLEPEWKVDIEGLRILNYAARDFRYPGETASLLFAQQCLNVAEPIRELLYKLLSDQ